MTRKSGLAQALLAGSLLLVAVFAAAQVDREIPPAIGPHVGLKPADFEGVPSFGPDDKVVMTYDFMWYDASTGEHMRDADGTDALTTHPASLEDFSYRSVGWHVRQLEDMIEAGIDVVLPVYWGAPSEHAPGSPFYWSFEALGPLVQAREALVRSGKNPPRIGLFYDTSTLQANAWNRHVDLTTPYGRQWFYATIRDFFSLIPPEHWALIDGRPIVSLYGSSFARAYDQGVIDHVKAAFPRDFGGKVPYVIREASWNVKADNTYAWGGAIRPSVLGVGSVGPGYDHSAVPGRDPLVVPREDGAFYERGWWKILRQNPQIVAIETWNEFHEGTDIAESREYGRKYIDLTRKYVDRFKSGWTPPAVEGPFAGASEVELVFCAEDREKGLRRVEPEDGLTQEAKREGWSCRMIGPGRDGPKYLYLVVDESFKTTPAMDVVVDVTYLDSGRGRFTVEYDSHDATATFGGAYTPADSSIELKDTGAWKTDAVLLKNARFANAQNGGADLRLAIQADSLAVNRVAIRREKDDGAQIVPISHRRKRNP